MTLSPAIANGARVAWPTIAQVATSLQVSRDTVRRRVADGTLEARRIGPRLIRINPESLEQLGEPLLPYGDAA